MNNAFPHYSQLDAMDCGPACLRMVAKHYGKSYSLQTLRERCFITREGVSMLGISDAAEFIGMRTIGVRISFEQLTREAALPCILHWNQNHFVVCYKIRRRRNGKTLLYIADPASRKATYSEEEFRRLCIRILTSSFLTRQRTRWMPITSMSLWKTCTSSTRDGRCLSWRIG